MNTRWRKRPAFRRLAGAVAALVLVSAAGASSAIFVDYLAERAKLRAYAAATMRKPAEVARTSGKTAPSPVKTAAVPADPKPAVTPDASAIARAARAAAAAVGALPGEPASGAVAGKTPAAAEAAAVPLPDKAVLAALKPQPEENLEIGIEPKVGADGGDPRDDAYTGAIAAMTPLPYAPVTATGVRVPLPDKGDDTGRAAKVTKHVNLRSRPADESKVLTVVPARASVNVLSCKSWCEVEYDGQKGFIYKRFIGKS
jgi:Bacterial SH3 domain